MRDSGKTKQMASGRWLSILRDLAPDLLPAVEMVGRHVPCPKGSGSKDGFRLFRDANYTGGGVSNQCGTFTDGFNLLMWVNDWSFPKAHDEVDGWLNGSSMVREPVKQVSYSSRKEKTSNAKKLRYLLNKMWTKAYDLESIEADPAVTYLARRRCFPLPWAMQDLGFHESLQYKDDDGNTQNFPGLLAVVRDKSGKPVTLHRTFLTPDGEKAPVDDPKRIMPVPADTMLSGSAIRLQPANWQGEVIGIAEGIETALCVTCATNMVCWSTMSSTFLANFEPPKWVKKVVIWADYDKERIIQKDKDLVDVGSAGQKAAEQLHERLLQMGVESEIRLPPIGHMLKEKKSVDWADIYSFFGQKPFFHGKEAKSC